MSDTTPDANLTVSVEQDGRVLSGVGVTKESLRETMDARSIDETPAASPPAGSEPASAGSPTGAAPSPTEQPKPTRGQARFSELTQQREAEKARADAAEKRAAELEARLSTSVTDSRSNNQPVSQQVQSQQQLPQSNTPSSSRPEPTEDEVGVGLKYETYGAFVKDWHKWNQEQQPDVNQLVAQGIAAHTQAQQFATHIETTRAKGRAAYKDFDAMLQNGPGTYVNMPAPAIQAIYHLPNSEHVQYAIMKDGALAQRLASLAATNPYAFGLELAKIAPASPAASPASTGNPGSATPPPPMQPVGSGSTTTKLSSAEHARTGNYEAYKAARNAERGVRRR